MEPTSLPRLPAEALQRLARLTADGQRRLLGLVGPPGAGKSTLAAALHAAVPERSQVVPMDGFHLANVELERLGRRARKGAPDTFDADGFAALLRRLRQQRPDEIADKIADNIVYAPEFRREIEEPIANAIPVLASTPLLIVEGNYLLAGRGPLGTPWPRCWTRSGTWRWTTPCACNASSPATNSFGRSPQAARDWVQTTDEPNARRIEASRPRATWRLRWDA